ncbi:DegT/DnrJ/EryC1/StrS family aminotransferase [Flavobacteriaceae bacterium]|nr:DegT/DnrJ/EryC1/StrS family aminotransferase [Flavobacteriaceae bacterium]
MIKLSQSDIGDGEKKAVMEVLENSYLGMGKYVEKFEQKLDYFFGRKAICVSSGTAAVQLALESCNIGVGDEVLVPSLTYIATFQAISATGATPVSCDVDEQSLIIDIKDASTKLSKFTKAIIPVYYSGGVGNIEAIYKFASKNKLRIIEDAAHAFGTTHQNKKIGSFGDITCFSFDGIKNITSGEGGCIVTGDVDVINSVKDKRLLGVVNDTEKRFVSERSWTFDVKSQGWRYHMSNIMAAIGIVQLERFDEFSHKRKLFAKLYDSLFIDNEKIKPLLRDYDLVFPHIYVVRIYSELKIDEIRNKMLEFNIQTGFHYFPNHLLSYYNKGQSLKVTEKIYQRILTLPLHTKLSTSDIRLVAKKLISILN